MKYLRIVSCVLACISVAAVVPVGIFFPAVYITVPVVAAGAFALIMLLAKKFSLPDPPKEQGYIAGANAEPEERKDPQSGEK